MVEDFILSQQLVELGGLLEEKTLSVESLQEIIEIPLECDFPHGGESLHLVHREDALVLVFTVPISWNLSTTLQNS